MKLLSQNLWGGKTKQKIFDFLQSYSDSVDIFLFQEVFRNGKGKPSGNLVNITDYNSHLYEDLQELFEGHIGIFCPVHKDIYGLAIFIRKGIKILSNGDEIVFDCPDSDDSNSDIDHTRKLQWVTIKQDGKQYLVMNIHGTWTISGKGDNEDRINQSRKILDFIKDKDVPIILGGDFNLDINTQSVLMLEGRFKNLIKEYNIKSTRPPFFINKDRYADYFFVTPEIKVNTFEVIMHSASDHAGMILDIP